MRVINLDDLPTNKNETVLWRKSVGCDVRFEYDDIVGKIQIINYAINNGNVKLLCKYNQREEWIAAGSLKKCRIGELIDKRRIDHIYNVGKIVFEQFLILEQIYMKKYESAKHKNKGYKVKCVKCGHIFDITEDNLERNHKCEACCDVPKKLVLGINDLQTKYPNIAKMLKHPEKAKTYIYNSTAREDWICPSCNNEIPDKAIDYVLHRGLKCPRCTDKHISFPERVMFELLKMLNVNFKIHTKFTWSQNKEYDFYLLDYNYIIETHGSQHYENWKNWNSGRTLKDEQENDRLKEEIAIQNNINKYIIIDCRISDFDYIFQNIIDSEISQIFDLSNIDISLLQLNIYSNNVMKVADLWNKGFKTYEQLIEETKLSGYIIRQYLKEASKLKLCDYTNKAMIEYKKENKLLGSNNKIKIRCVNDDIIFQSIVDAAKYYNTSPQTVKRSCAENKIKNINGRELKFEFASETNQNNTTT